MLGTMEYLDEEIILEEEEECFEMVDSLDPRYDNRILDPFRDFIAFVKKHRTADIKMLTKGINRSPEWCSNTASKLLDRMESGKLPIDIVLYDLLKPLQAERAVAWWSPAEDAKLIRLCIEIGNNYSVIVTHFNGRSRTGVIQRTRRLQDHMLRGKIPSDKKFLDSLTSKEDAEVDALNSIVEGNLARTETEEDEDDEMLLGDDSMEDMGDLE